MGDYLAIFPNANLRNRACNICAFDLGAGVQIQMARWTRNYGMVPDPTTHKAHIRIHELPMEFWNKEELTELVSGFGTLERMSDFLANDNYEELRVLVACYHPMHIPEDSTVSENSSSVAVHFELEGWLLTSAIQTPPNKMIQKGKDKEEE